MRWLIAALFTLALTIPAAALAEDVAATFKAKCANCHGDDGKGKTKMGEKLKVKDYTTEEGQKGSDEDFKKAVAEGIKDKKMPAFKDKLKAEEIDALLKHVRGFKK